MFASKKKEKKSKQIEWDILERRISERRAIFPGDSHGRKTSVFACTHTLQKSLKNKNTLTNKTAKEVLACWLTHAPSNRQAMEREVVLAGGRGTVTNNCAHQLLNLGATQTSDKTVDCQA